MNKSKFSDLPATAAAAGGEAIIICIDNTTRIRDYGRAQVEAARSYATYKIQSHPRTAVGLVTMCEIPYDEPYLDPNLFLTLPPTRDLDKFLNTLKCIKVGGELDFAQTVSICQLLFARCPPEWMTQKRMVMFAGGIINMSVEVAKVYGNPLKEKGIAVDVVNFDVGHEHDLRKKKLEAFVAAVDDNHNSQIIHVDERSSLSNLLSRFMGGDEHVEPKGLKNKDHQVIHSKTSGMKKKATENENVKRDSEPSSSLAKGTKNKEQQFFVEEGQEEKEQGQEQEQEEHLSKTFGVAEELLKKPLIKKPKKTKTKTTKKTETETGKMKGLLIFLGLLIFCFISLLLVFFKQIIFLF